MPEGAALSWSFSDIVIRRKGRLDFRCRVPGARYSTNGRFRRIPVLAGRSSEGLLSLRLRTFAELRHHLIRSADFWVRL